MDKAERAVRTLFGFDSHLMHTAVGRLRKKQRKRKQTEEVKEIEELNGGYFVLPQNEKVEDRLFDDGPEQLKFDFIQTGGD